MPRPHIYYEVRTMHVFGPPMPVASDIARHLQSRQYLGMTIVVCSNPLSMLSAVRKQWLRLARNLQKQRASTLNAEEILRFTHTIMHMQHLQFVAQLPIAGAEGHIFFVHPNDLATLPPGCLTLYLTVPPRKTQLNQWLDDMSRDALVVDYEGNINLQSFGLSPKKEIEARMLEDWEDLQELMRKSDVAVDTLVTGTTLESQAIDRAVDNLLGTGNIFLRRAAEFQHMLSLAQPLKNTPAVLLKKIEAVMRVAHRVQSLTPGSFGSFLAHTFGDSRAESFFLRDAAPEEEDADLPRVLITHEYADTATFMVYI
jgi:hypothetical protein